tara:strand:+ start:767 stop:1024 length:258 start_codon:yes stop_codon:yes gene_type:complete
MKTMQSVKQIYMNSTSFNPDKVTCYIDDLPIDCTHLKQQIMPDKVYKREANPNATNSELDAKIIIKHDNKEEKDSSPYDNIPKRY